MAAARESKPHLLIYTNILSDVAIGQGPGAAAPKKERDMIAALIIFGMGIGFCLSAALCVIYFKIQDAREEEEREIREARERRMALRQKMNEPREPLSQCIMDQAQKGLKRRDEG